MGTGWSSLDGLAAGAESDGDRPNVVRRGTFDGATVLQLTFRAGQVLADHSTAKPVLLLGQRGTITVTVAGDERRLGPGDAVHIDARVVHAVSADEPADMTLILLG